MNLLGLPKSTEFNRRIPKQKFYEHLSVTPTLKRVFIDRIKQILWRNKIAATTMNLAAGKNVTEIEIIEVQLDDPELDVSVLREIDKHIPYHIIFLLEYNRKYQAWVTYKEAGVSNSNIFKVGIYYHTSWMVESDLTLKVEGLNIDIVYENFVRQIAGETLQKENNESLKDSVARDERIRQVEKEMLGLKKKIRREKQLNKQMLLNTELKKLRKEVEEQF